MRKHIALQNGAEHNRLWTDAHKHVEAQTCVRTCTHMHISFSVPQLSFWLFFSFYPCAFSCHAGIRIISLLGSECHKQNPKWLQPNWTTANQTGNKTRPALIFSLSKSAAKWTYNGHHSLYFIFFIFATDAKMVTWKKEPLRWLPRWCAS